MMKYFILLVIPLLLAAGCGGTGTETTTTVSVSTTTTSSVSTTSTTLNSQAIIRLYYTYPTNPAGLALGGKDYSSQNFGSAYSTDGATFTVESGARLTSGYLSDPDFFKESTGHWVLFYSRAVSTEAPDRSILYKAISATPNGSFTDDASFTGGSLGNISATLKVGSNYYVYLVSSEGITIAAYDPTLDKISYLGKAVSGNVADPSAIQLSANSFKLFYKLSGNTYIVDSTDGLTWTNSQLVVNYAEVAGAVYVNSKIYLYYTDSDPASADNGKIVLKISSDGGSSFGSPQATTGWPAGACDPDPVAYE